MKKLLFLVVLSLVAALALAPPVGAQQEGGEGVRMEDNYFDQADVTVPAGTTVTWVQAGDNPHTSTSYDGLRDSGRIQGGAKGSVSYTFEEPGTDVLVLLRTARGPGHGRQRHGHRRYRSSRRSGTGRDRWTVTGAASHAAAPADGLRPPGLGPFCAALPEPYRGR